MIAVDATGAQRRGVRGQRPLPRWLRILVVCIAGATLLPATAQDTPEMLAAMRGHLPPVPEAVPLREALPAELRADIPPFRIEVHRWHADPAQRFVVIHGRRIEQGGVVDRELWLREVREDGVVLQFRDAFFLQPR